MFLQRIFRALLIAVLAGVTGFVLGRTFVGSRAPAAPSSPISQAPSGGTDRPLPEMQSSPDPPTDTPPAVRQSSAPGRVTTLISPSAPKTLITVTDNRLSVQAQQRSLAWIVDEIARQSGLAILRSAELQDQTVSIQFQDLPFDQGLQLLLKTVDAFFFYGTEGDTPAALKTVWLYPPGQGQSIVPAPPETYASTAEMQQHLRDPDPDQRARAIEILIERQGAQALDMVLQVLQDPDEGVRSRALQQAVQLSLPLPVDLMQHLALSDAAPVIRFLALEAIVRAPDVDPEQIRVIAEQVLDDPSAELQEHAADVLVTLDSAQQPEESSEPLQGQEEDQSE